MTKEKKSKIRICKYCNTKIDRDGNFCPYCGSASLRYKGKREKEEDSKYVVKIEGGDDEDNHVGCIGDYFNTVFRAKLILEGKDCTPPFTIISNIWVRQCASTGNHFRIGQDNHLKKQNRQISMIGGNVYLELLAAMKSKDVILFDNNVFDEGQYIEDLPWIDKWIIDNERFIYNDDKYYPYKNIMIITDGEYEVRTGDLTLY